MDGREGSLDGEGMEAGRQDGELLPNISWWGSQDWDSNALRQLLKHLQHRKHGPILSRTIATNDNQTDRHDKSALGIFGAIIAGKKILSKESSHFQPSWLLINGRIVHPVFMLNSEAGYIGNYFWTAS
jgi:hypothetical protein